MSLTPPQAELIRAYHQNREEGILPRPSVVVGGAAMVLCGMKPTTDDLDVVVPREHYDLLARRPDILVRCYDDDDRTAHLRFNGRGPRPVLDADIPSYGLPGQLDVMLAPRDTLYAATFAELLGNAWRIDDVPVIGPRDLLRWKRAVGRHKDQQDALLIVTWLRAWTSEGTGT